MLIALSVQFVNSRPCSAMIRGVARTLIVFPACFEKESGMRTSRVLSSMFSRLPTSVTGINRLAPEGMTWCSVVMQYTWFSGISYAHVITHASADVKSSNVLGL